MTRKFSGEDLVKALTKARFKITGRKGSHVKLEFIDKNTDERRIVIVPLHDEIDSGTLKSIAEQAGAKDFQKFKKWIENLI